MSSKEQVISANITPILAAVLLGCALLVATQLGVAEPRFQQGAQVPRLAARPLPTPGPLADLEVVAVLDSGCRSQAPTASEELACLGSIYERCTALSEFGCLATAASSHRACKPLFPRLATGESNHDYKAWWSTVLGAVVPELRALGWCNVRSEAAFNPQALASADVVVMRYKDSWVRKMLQAGKPSQRLVLVHKADASTLPAEYRYTLEHEKVMLILKQVVVQPVELLRGPLLSGLAHVAELAPQAGLAHKLQYQNWTDATLQKIHALMPMTVIHRYPWSCGSGLSKVRFAGFFHPTLAHTWSVPRLRDRKYDVAILGKADYGRGSGELLTKHRALGRQAVLDFQAAYGDRYRVLVPETRAKDYPDYLQTLLDTKILVSPWGWGEWSLKDFEALLCGCLLVKPSAGRYLAYPDIYHPGVSVLSVDHSFTSLTAVLLGALSDGERMQRMADAAADTFRRHSDPTVIAADFSRLLLDATARHHFARGAGGGGPAVRRPSHTASGVVDPGIH